LGQGAGELRLLRADVLHIEAFRAADLEVEPTSQ
jgi:hypothetical protein